MEASLGAKVECVQLLLDGGAQVDEQNKVGVCCVFRLR